MLYPSELRAHCGHYRRCLAGLGLVKKSEFAVHPYRDLSDDREEDARWPLEHQNFQSQIIAADPRDEYARVGERRLIFCSPFLMFLSRLALVGRVRSKNIRNGEQKINRRARKRERASAQRVAVQ